MRPHSSVLIQLALLTSSGHAFFPWLASSPEDLGNLEDFAHSASQVKPSGVGKGITFEITQRARNDPATSEEKVGWQTSFIGHKYDHVNAVKASSGGSIAKRANQYPVMPAADLKQPRTAGLNQDGIDYAYFIKVKLGSEGKELYMLTDSGAGSSWVMSIDCKSEACLKHNTFGSGDSHTLDTSSSTFSLQYGSGDVKGVLANDTIKVADMSLKYQFGLATTTSDDFLHFPFDGILGLSMSSGANQNFLQALADEHLLEENIFCVALNRASDGPNNGEIRFGSTNPDRFTGGIGYTPIGHADDEWAIQLGDLSFDGKKAGVGNRLAYIDTGTSYIFGPPDHVKTLHSLIPGAETQDNTTYTVPCDMKKPLAVNFSGVDYDISPEDWISPKDSTGKCTSNIFGFEAVSGAWLMGDTLLKNVYAVFDKDQRRIGFAKRASANGASSTTTIPIPIPTNTPWAMINGTAASSASIATVTQTSKSSPAISPPSFSAGGALSLACISLSLLSLL